MPDTASPAPPAPQPNLPATSPTRAPRMPVLFLGHGSPMNAIEDNGYRRAWQAVGARFGREFARPTAIVCISAHWLTRGWWLTGMAMPRTIHDFGGFPQALFDQHYPAPGAPHLATTVATELTAATAWPVGVDASEWGLDHGSWGVLKPMFPEADIPVLQLSIDYARPLAEHLAMGRHLRFLRERGVLVVGSGNIVHNLRALVAPRPGCEDACAFGWASDFDAATASALSRGDAAALCDLAALCQSAAIAKMAHPTHEHYLPLLYAAGAAHPGDTVQFFNEGFQAGSISMRSVIWTG